MYQQIKTKRFVKAYNKICRSGKYQQALDELNDIIRTIARGEKLASKYRDHQLKGDMQEFRECHIRSDVLLLYRTDRSQLILILIDIGSHSYFFE
ncbi:MAG: type II toxin-antitoxin system YafQ family toxin [Patescibacteria group bacterium]